jgi:hypothetical protein
MGYFNYIPDFNYVDRNPNAKLGDQVRVKNLFRRIKLREDIFQDTTVFEKYQIRGDDRPDNIAYQFYGRSDYDWIVLVSNNIVNIQTEWPMPQNTFDSFILNKYGTYQNANAVRHYETREVKNTQGVTIVPAGQIVDKGYSYTYYEEFQQAFVDTGDITVEVTNYDYETRIEEAKRNIFLLKRRYLPVILDDIEKEMKYKKGSSDYISGTLKSSDNIRLTT